MIRLKAENLHWLEPEPEYDQCVHGAVYLEINGHVFSDGKNDEWTPSGSAFHLLKSLDGGHDIGDLNLIPCCAWPIYLSDQEYIFSTCPFGINWQISFNGELVVHSLNDSVSFEVPSKEWKKAIVEFAKQINSFYKDSPARKFNDRADEIVFNNYYTEFEQLIRDNQ